MASCAGIKGDLDITRLDKGPDGLKSFFVELGKKDHKEAIRMLNEENLHFCSLYILNSEIKVLNLYDHMNLRNKIALDIIYEVLEGSNSIQSAKCSSSEYIQTVCSVLKWILFSGFSDDGLEDDYDKVLDASSALLIKVYGDRTALPVMVDAIFERNRKGCLYNDLVWAFFEARYPYSLILIASRLLSRRPEDAGLAQRLLSFIPGINIKRTVDYERQYLNALQWLKENYPFLHFTGESFQQFGNPKPYRVVLEARYLYKPVFIDTGKIIEPLTGNEHKLLKDFMKLDDYSRTVLSNYSLMLHNRNIYSWNKWIHRRVAN